MEKVGADTRTVLNLICLEWGKPWGKMPTNLEKSYPEVQGLIRLAPDSVGAKHAPPEHSTPFSALSICTYLTTAVNMAEMLINTYFFYAYS